MYSIFYITDKKEKSLIEDSIKDIENKSCVKFRKRRNNQEYAVVFQVCLFFFPFAN